MNRRQLLSAITATGIGTTVFHRALAGIASQEAELTVEMIKNAEWVSAIELDDTQREEMLASVKGNTRMFAALREIELTADVAPATYFQPLQKKEPIDELKREAVSISTDTPALPDNDEEIAFLPVHQLSLLVKAQKISSVRLTGIYLERLKKYAPMLRCMVTLTEDLAMRQAKRADEEIASGSYHGPLHGIPWGAKDLISVPGYPTSWGIPYYKDRELETTATVAKRLEEAGAVLVAKLSLGALAMGDRWFGGLTRNPWNPRLGSSGSSAGSASAVVAGLVGFTLGTETLGSILSPSIRCGSSGFRPTFGRVSRHGCMPLSWSMDKVGPLCRSIEDCALVFDAIHGADGLDPTAQSFDFRWPSNLNLKGLRIGVTRIKEAPGQKEDVDPQDADGEVAKQDQDPQEVLRRLGCELVEVDLPKDLPLRALTSIINVEGASVFDSLLRDGHTEGWNRWPGTFRAAQMISAVDYLRSQRVRTKLMNDFERAIENVDILFNMNELVHTNLTGHPSAVLPLGYRQRGEGAKAVIPVVITGHLQDDDRLLALANAFQQQYDAHLRNPPMDDWLEKHETGQLDRNGGGGD